MQSNDYLVSGCFQSDLPPPHRWRMVLKKLSNLSCRTVLAHLESIIKSKRRRGFSEIIQFKVRNYLI